MKFTQKKISSLPVPVLEVAALFLLIVVTFLLYSNTLHNTFIHDDWHSIVDNSSIRVTKITPEAIKGIFSYHQSRPVAMLSLAANYYFHQYKVFGYHLVNIVVHCATGLFLYFFIKTTLSLPSLQKKFGPPGWLPWAVALIWLVHPLQTQSVSYLIQRMNSMAALFYILAMLLYAKGRLARSRPKKTALFIGVTIFGFLAMGSKQIAATLPFFIYLYELYFFQDLKWSRVKRQVLPAFGVLVLLVIIVFFFLGQNPFASILGGYRYRDFTLFQRVLTEWRVVLHYLSLLAFPHPSRLHLEYAFPLSYSLVSPRTTLMSFLTLAGLFILAVWIARKERILSFCILWYLGQLVIESSVIGLSIIFEHRTYLPSMFAVLLAVHSVNRFIPDKKVKTALLAIIVTILSFWTFQRNMAWKDNISIWFDSVSKAPNSVVSRQNLAVALKHKKRFDEAIIQFQEAIRLDPQNRKLKQMLVETIRIRSRPMPGRRQCPSQQTSGN